MLDGGGRRDGAVDLLGVTAAKTLATERGGAMRRSARSSRTAIADLDGSVKFLQNTGWLWEQA